MRYFRLSFFLLFLIGLWLPLIAEEVDTGKLKVLPINGLDMIRMHSRFMFPVSSREVAILSRDRDEKTGWAKDTAFILNVLSGEKKEISTDVVEKPGQVHVLDGRKIYFCNFNWSAREQNHSVCFESYDLETKEWSTPVTLQTQEGLEYDSDIMRTTVKCVGTNAYISSYVLEPTSETRFPGEDADRVRNGEAKTLNIEMHVDMETGKLIDRFTFCTLANKEPEIGMCISDPFRRNLIKYETKSKKLLFESVGGDRIAQLDVSKYFPEDEIPEIRVFEDEILLCGYNNFMLIDEKYTTKDVIPSMKLKTESGERWYLSVERFARGCFSVSKGDLECFVLNFNEKDERIIELGHYLFGEKVCGGSLFWESQWGDLMMASLPDFKAKAVKEHFLGYNEDSDEHSFSGNYLFLPVCDGKTLKVFSPESGKLERAMDFSNNPVVDFAVATDCVDRVAVLLSDGTLKVINSVTLTVEKELLLKEVSSHRHCLSRKLIFSEHQIITLFRLYSSPFGYRFDFTGKVLEKFEGKEERLSENLCGRGVYELGDRIIIPYNISVSKESCDESIISGGYLISQCFEEDGKITFSMTSLHTGEKSEYEFGLFPLADTDDLLLEYPAWCYREPYLVGVCKKGSELLVYSANLDTGRVNCEEILDPEHEDNEPLYIAPLSRGRFLAMMNAMRGYCIYKLKDKR